MTDTPLVTVNATQSATARTNGWPVYSVTQTTEYADPGYATPKVAPAPPPPPPAPSSTYQFGMNEHFLMWTAPSAYPIAIMQKLGVKVCRNDLYGDGKTSSFTGALTSAKTISGVQTWATALRAGGIQPLVVVTFPGKVLPAAFASDMATLAAACPGIWWEIGNELDASGISAASYVPFFAATVKAVQTADSTCKIGPSPVSNIDQGGGGWGFTQKMFATGLAAIPYDFHPFHSYQYPGNIPPNVTFFHGTLGTPTFLEAIPFFIEQLTTWGNTKPPWLTEFGYKSLTTNSKDPTTLYPEMTEALQAEYVLQELAALKGFNIPVAIVYELGDGGGETYGWYTANWAAPKEVVAAVQALMAGH